MPVTVTVGDSVGDGGAPDKVTTRLLLANFSEKILVRLERTGVEGGVIKWEELGEVSDPLKLNKDESPVELCIA